MSAAVSLAVAVWLVIGLAISFTMTRRGHSPVIWFALCFYGPLAGLLALTARTTEDPGAAEVLDRGRAGPGPLSVLVGLDGSAESRNALDAVIGLFGAEVGQLTLATVLDFDESEVPGQTGRRDEATSILQNTARDVESRVELTPATALLKGAAGPALSKYATQSGYHMIAVGSRGAGATRLVMGSAAMHLSASADTPVLVVPKEYHAPTL